MSSYNSDKTGSGHFLILAGETQKKPVRNDALPDADRPGPVALPVRRDRAGHSGARSEKEKENREERVARIEKEAYEKGFEQGRRDGFALEEKQLEENGKQFKQLFNELDGLKTKICSETEGQLLNLSIAIAKKIIREEVRIQPKIIQQTVRAALNFLVDKNQIRILINPEDMEEVRKLLPDIAAVTKGGQFQVVEDQAIGRGGCFMETSFGAVNATLEDQIGMIEKVIEECFKAYEGKG
jgi:flagellar assembly protein FliH